MRKREYEALKKEMRTVADLEKAGAILSWDQETMMPEEGGAFRAQQLATLSGIAHERFTDEENSARLDRLSGSDQLEANEQKNLERIREDFDKARKYSTEFVQELSRAQSEAFQAWRKAKEADDFEIFAPELERMVSLKQKEAGLLGYEDHPYDPLLDSFEPGLKTQEVERVFKGLRARLEPLLSTLKSSSSEAEEGIMYRHYPVQEQLDFSLEVLQAMGYDLKKGRQDLSPHPFTISFSPQDVRVTTRMDANNLHEGIWSSIHEGGHALYEQGLPIEAYGLPEGEACSLAIHESQARLWENIIGRGRAFWQHFFPKLKDRFPENLKDVNLDQFLRAMNTVRPSLIRTNADELTYHFHIIIRFEIEKALIEGSLKVKDVPEVWNQKYEEYLGVEVPSDAQGCLQDVHWSHGGFGYFPTYSLGSLYSAQFYKQASEEQGDLEEKIAKGDLHTLREWLRENIHQWGRLERSGELCKRVTGKELDPDPFIDYAWKKYGDLYPVNSGTSEKEA